MKIVYNSGPLFGDKNCLSIVLELEICTKTLVCMGYLEIKGHVSESTYPVLVIYRSNFKRSIDEDHRDQLRTGISIFEVAIG